MNEIPTRVKSRYNNSLPFDFIEYLQESTVWTRQNFLINNHLFTIISILTI